MVDGAHSLLNDSSLSKFWEWEKWDQLIMGRRMIPCDDGRSADESTDRPIFRRIKPFLLSCK